MKNTRVHDLRDGDEFSLDGGTTWHVCAVSLFGSVAVYTDDRRDNNAPTTRIPAASTDVALVR